MNYFIANFFVSVKFQIVVPFIHPFSFDDKMSDFVDTQEAQKTIKFKY